MIRMTLILLMGIGVTMAIFGDDTGRTQGSDAGTVVVTRIDSNEPGLLTRVGSLIEGTTQAQDEIERVPLADEKRAIEIALAATVAPADPAAPMPQTVQLGAPAPANAAPAQDQNLWYVTGNTVNLRGGPSTSDAVVGSVHLGQQAEVIEKTADGWLRIRTLDDGQNGYIFGRFLSQNRPG